MDFIQHDVAELDMSPPPHGLSLKCGFAGGLDAKILVIRIRTGEKHFSLSLSFFFKVWLTLEQYRFELPDLLLHLFL